MEKSPGKKLGTTFKTSGIGEYVEQFTYEGWVVKEIYQDFQLKETDNYISKNLEIENLIIENFRNIHIKNKLHETYKKTLHTASRFFRQAIKSKRELN